jgi:pimeloyl-ACP methyl ester carboxylesterase
VAQSETLASWYEDGEHFQFESHSIFYKDEGAGDVIVCMHGFPTASWDWFHVWKLLRGRFRLIAPDMLGFGYSAKPRKHHYSIHEQARLYQSLLEHLGISRFHILAHDIGDNVTQELLASQLENPRFDIQSICLLNGGIFPKLIEPRSIQKLLLKPILGPLIMLFYNRAVFGKQFSEVFSEKSKPSSDELDTFWALIDKGKGQQIIPRLLQYIPEGLSQSERWVTALQNCPAPLKVIMGLDDPVSGKPMLDCIPSLIPQASVTALEGVGHYPQVETPEKVLLAYLEFLDTLA